MRKRAEFLLCQGENGANEAFLLIYKQSILFALHHEGYLDRDALDGCLRLLGNNYTGGADKDACGGLLSCVHR